MTDTKRTAYTQGLRAVADLLDAHPDLPLPYGLTVRNGLAWYVHDSIETVLAIRELMDEPLTLPYDSRDFPVEITGTLAGFAATVDVARGIALDPREGFIVPRPAMNPRLLAEQVSA
jgi:hypothetical protein